MTNKHKDCSMTPRENKVMRYSGEGIVGDPLDLSEVRYDLSHSLEHSKGFPRLDGNTKTGLVQGFKKGDLINWAGYSDQELDFFYHHDYRPKGGKLGVRNYKQTYKEFIKQYPIYGIVTGFSDRHFPYKNIPTAVSTVLNLTEEGDLMGGIASLSWYELDEEWFPLHRIRKSSVEETTSSLIYKVKKMLKDVSEIKPDDSKENKLLACIKARKASRIAEITAAVYQFEGEELLKLVKRLNENPIITPRTNTYVLRPKVFGSDPDFPSELLRSSNPGDVNLSEEQVAKIAEMVHPDLFKGMTTLGEETSLGYIVYAIPKSALHLVEGIDAYEITFPTRELMFSEKDQGLVNKVFEIESSLS